VLGETLDRVVFSGVALAASHKPGSSACGSMARGEAAPEKSLDGEGELGNAFV